VGLQLGVGFLSLRVGWRAGGAKLPAPVGEGQGWGQYSEIAANVLGRCVDITDPTPNPSP